MSQQKFRPLLVMLRGFGYATLAGLSISTFSGLALAGETQPHSNDSLQGETLSFPTWEPLYETQRKEASPAKKDQNSQYIMRVSPFKGEELNEAGNTLEQFIEQALAKSGHERESAFKAVWRRYRSSLVAEHMVNWIDSGTEFQGVVAAEVLLQGGRFGTYKLDELLATSNKRLGDRTALALANLGPDALPVFARGLERDSAAGWLRCAWGLGRIGGPEAARILARLSGHQGLPLRLVAAESLGHLDAKDRREYLGRFAHDDAAAIRLRVAEIYAQEPWPDVLPELMELAVDPEASVRVAAAVALSNLPSGSEEALQGLLGDFTPAVRAEASRALVARLDEPGRMKLLKSEDNVARHAACEAMLELPSVPVAIFQWMAREPDPDIRRQALNGIVQSEDPDAAKAALAFLEDSESDLRGDALEFVVANADALDPVELSRIAEHTSPAVRERIAAMLITSRDPNAMAALTRLTDVPSAHVRAMIVARLGESSEHFAMEAIARMSQDEDLKVRRGVVVSLSRMPFDEARESMEAMLVDQSPVIRKDAALLLGMKRDPRSVLPLAALDHDPNTEVRLTALRAIAHIGDDVAAGALSSFMNDANPSLRHAALDSLASIGSSMAMGYVGELFSHPDRDMRVAAIGVLNQVSEDRPELAAAQLCHFAHDPVSDIQMLAIRSAGQTGHGAALEGLVALAEEQEARVRLEAVAAIGSVRDKRAADALERFAYDEDDDVRLGAYKGLAKVGGTRGFELLIEGLGDQQEHVRVDVVHSIARLHLSAAVPRLIAQLPKSEIVEQKAILDALGQIRSPEATSVLLDLQANGGVFDKIMAKKALDHQTEPPPEIEWARQNSPEAIVTVTYEPPPRD